MTGGVDHLGFANLELDHACTCDIADGNFLKTDEAGVKTCIACHKYCQMCVGQYDSHCISCPEISSTPGAASINILPVTPTDPTINISVYRSNIGYCSMVCKSGFYPMQDRQIPEITISCLKCHKSCSKCTGSSPMDCDQGSCMGPKYFWNEKHKLCQENCSAGTYYHLEIFRCNNCMLHCSECKDRDTCDTCAKWHKNYYYSDHQGNFKHQCLNTVDTHWGRPQAGVPDPVDGRFHYRCDKLLANCKFCKLDLGNKLARC
jgi:hypothetical protein